MRHRSLAIAAVCLLSLLSTEAFGSTASTRIKRVWYTAAPGEVNNLTISLADPNYTLVDAGAAITAQPACVAVRGRGSSARSPGSSASPWARVTGPTASRTRPRSRPRSRAVTATTRSPGGSGNDTLRGNKGVDTHAGGAGDDLIDARGDRGDIVTCGDGNDTVLGDAADSIAAGLRVG